MVSMGNTWRCQECEKYDKLDWLVVCEANKITLSLNCMTLKLIKLI